MGKSSVKDIANLSGVSLGTVDRVLNNRGNVSAKSKKAVEEAIKELNYVPNIAARMLANPKPLTIAIILPLSHNENGFWRADREGINTAALELKDKGITLIEYRYQLNSREEFKTKFNKAIDDKVDGILTAPIYDEATKEFAIECAKLKVPICFIDRLPENESNVSFNGISPERSARSAADLFDFGLNLPNEQVLCLAVLALGESTSTVKKRQHGFTQYFKDNHKSKAVVHGTIMLNGTEQNQLDKILENENIKGVFVLNSRSFLIAPLLNKDVTLIGYDLFPENLIHLKTGKIKYLINSQSERQGFDGIMKLSRLLTRQEKEHTINYFPTTFTSLENLVDTLEEQK